MGIPLNGHSYHSKTNVELLYIVRDAGMAANAMRNLDYVAECKYLDQVNDACTVLHHRRIPVPPDAERDFPKN